MFSVKIGTHDKAYVFESAIDLLSFRQLANPAKIQNSVLVSMAGLKPTSLKTLLERGLKLYACVDNDEAGIKFTNNKSEMDVLIADVKNIIAAASEQAKSAREDYEESLRQKKIADELNAADTLTKSLVDLLIKRVYIFPDNRIEIEYLSRSFIG